MLRVSLRDLQWRRRRFAIAIIGTSLVFAMTLVLAGLSQSFRSEADHTVQSMGADAWVVSANSGGPFSALTPVPERTVDDVRQRAGVVQASPLVVIHQTARKDGFSDVNVIGYARGGLGQPRLSAGRLPNDLEEAAVNDSLGYRVGDQFDMGQLEFSVVGLVHAMTYNGGTPNVYMLLKDAQAVGFQGAGLISAVLTTGTPADVPSGFKVMSNPDVRADMLRPLGRAIRAIDLVEILLWIVAATIVGSVVYLSAMERVRDFAVLKATGASNRGLVAGLALQATIISVGSALLGAGIAILLALAFPIALTIPATAFVLLPLIALAVGIVASSSGVRRAITADPALAFGA